MATQVTVGNSVFNLPSSSVINPGSVFQTYTPGSGTTYGAAPAGMASLGSTLANGTQAPAVETPKNTPSNAAVYQSNGIYAPMSQQTAFTYNPTTGGANLSPYSQNPSAYPNVKPLEIPAKVSSPEAITKELNTAVNKKTPAGQQIKDPKELDFYKEGDIARTSGGIYRRDLAKEQSALKQYGETYGKMPSTSEDWKKLNDIAYGVTAPSKTGLPTNSEVTDAAGSKITTDEAGVPKASESVTFTTQLNQIVAEITQTRQEFATKKSELAKFQADTSKYSANIGNQLGRSSGLVQGEQYALKQQRQADETLIVNEANALQEQLIGLNQDKQFIVQEAQRLSQNAQQNLAMILTTMKGSDTKYSDIPLAQRQALETLATQAGVPAGMLGMSIDAMANTAKYEKDIEALKVMSSGGVSESTRAGLVANLVATGLSVAEATSRVNEIINGSATSGTGNTGGGNGGSGEGGMRTDRHNNPTAMTTDVAKTLGLKEGVDYTVGDPFQAGDTTLYTANLLGDGVQTTVKALDLAAKDKSKQAFYTNSGNQRWSHTAVSDESWNRMTNQQKTDLVLEMYQKEGGNGKFGTTTPPPPTPPENPFGKYNLDVVTAGENAHKRGTLEGVDAKILNNVQNYMTEKGYEIPSSKPQTAEQTKAAGFYDRATPANDIMGKKEMEDYITSLGTLEFTYQKYTPNFLKSPEFQSFEQARRQFTEAYLRRDSGAAISDKEYDSADKTYFPQPGDSADVLTQKKQARKTVLDSLVKEAGRNTPANLNDTDAYKIFLDATKPKNK
jgi:hypothetical protein